MKNKINYKNLYKNKDNIFKKRILLKQNNNNKFNYN